MSRRVDQCLEFGPALINLSDDHITPSYVDYALLPGLTERDHANILAHRNCRFARCGGAYLDHLRLLDVRSEMIFVSAGGRKPRSAEEQARCRNTQRERQFRQAIAPVQTHAQ